MQYKIQIGTCGHANNAMGIVFLKETDSAALGLNRLSKLIALS